MKAKNLLMLIPVTLVVAVFITIIAMYFNPTFDRGEGFAGYSKISGEYYVKYPSIAAGPYFGMPLPASVEKELSDFADNTMLVAINFQVKYKLGAKIDYKIEKMSGNQSKIIYTGFGILPDGTKEDVYYEVTTTLPV